MKSFIFTALSLIPLFLFSQTNSFPTSGNAGIGTLSPIAPLHINGGTTMSAGWNRSLVLSANYPVIALNSFAKWGGIGYDSGGGMRFWVNSSTEDLPYHGLSAITVTNQGNVGIGVTTVNNTQAWDRVLQLNGPLHSKLLVTENSGVKLGLFSHTGGYAKIGTESNHNLSLMAGYWNDVMTLTTTGNVGIGITNPAEKLSVNGTIRAKEIKVEISGWPDYVFEETYKLKTLGELENFIKKNKHLPNIPSAKTIESAGLSLGEMNKMLLEKIEELTLHLISKEKEIENLKKSIARVDNLENETLMLKILINELLSKK